MRPSVFLTVHYLGGWSQLIITDNYIGWIAALVAFFTNLALSPSHPAWELLVTVAGIRLGKHFH